MKKFLLLLIIFSCTDNDDHIVLVDELTIEGQIIEGEFARINLTNSLPFNGVIDSLEVAKSIESKAKVVLSDGNVSEILTLKRDDSRFPFLFYRSNILKGELGKEYNLSISIRGKEFKSNTTIPEPAKVLDIVFSDRDKDGEVNLGSKNITLTIENDTQINRYFKVLIKKENEEKFELAEPFIFNTENISTDTFPVIISYIDFNDQGKKENLIKTGEVIDLKLIAITKEQFDFWKSIKGDETTPLENSSFTNAINTNISNGAFGYWSGENIESFKFIIP